MIIIFQGNFYVLISHNLKYNLYDFSISVQIVRLPSLPPTPVLPQERLLKLFVHRKEEVEGQDIIIFLFFLSDLQRLFPSWSY